MLFFYQLAVSAPLRLFVLLFEAGSFGVYEKVSSAIETLLSSYNFDRLDFCVLLLGP